MDIKLTEELINGIMKIATESSECDKADKKNLFILSSLETLYNMILKCGDGAVGKFITEGTPQLGLRVIKLNRPVPPEVLHATDKMKDESGIYNRVFCSGIYIVHPAIHIPREFLKSNCVTHLKKGDIYHIKDVPEVQDLGVTLVESTLRINSDGSGLVLCASPITDYINAGSHYKMLEVY